jgi:mRNA interferase MazF
MAIQYSVPPGTILRCDYSRGGFQEPEMVKIRPAIVVSPRLRHRDWLCTVVPISTAEPERDLPYVVKLGLTLPEPFDNPVGWAKCDMLATVAFSRLDLFRTARDRLAGRRRYLQPRLSPDDFAGYNRAFATPSDWSMT